MPPTHGAGLSMFEDDAVVSPEGNNAEKANEEEEMDDDSVSTGRLPPVVLRIPNTSFGIPLGLSSHAVMWKSIGGSNLLQNGTQEQAADLLNKMCWCLAILVAGAVELMYLYKIFTSYQLVKSEWLNEVRCHFFNAPNLVCLLLLMSIPENIEVADKTLRILWGLSFSCQILLTTNIYKAWMFSHQRNFSKSKPQFLMSIIGWFCLAAFGEGCNIKSEWGIGLPQMCFGAGFILYIDIMVFIFSKLHTTQGMKGSPGMFLLIAPPSVAVICLDLFNDDSSAFSETAEMLLGWVYVLLILLICLGPRIWKAPTVLGEYWAYVFPLASATNATIRYATAMRSAATAILAVMMVLISITTLLLVFGRMMYHTYHCILVKDQWEDPLFDKEKYQTRQAFKR